jgi:uncharacterized membrane protein
MFAYSLLVITNGMEINCVHQQQTGFECNTCGMTRGLNSFLRADFQLAKSFNESAVPFGIFLLIQFLQRVLVGIIALSNSKFIRPRNALFIEVSIAIVFMIMISPIKN